MQFFKLKDLAKSWSTWVLGAVTVVPVLDSNLEAVSNFIPAEYKPWFITGLGILGLVVRAIKQKGLSK